MTKPIWTTRNNGFDIRCIDINKAGILPYIRTDTGIYFCMGKDKNTGELRDFSGNKSCFDKDAEDTALRQCRVDSLGVFNLSKLDLEIMNTMYLFDDNDLIIFVDITNWNRVKESYTAEFNKFYECGKNGSSMGEIVWISADNTIRIISKCLGTICHQTRSSIRDISKIVPIINVEYNNGIRVKN